MFYFTFGAPYDKKFSVTRAFCNHQTPDTSRLKFQNRKIIDPASQCLNIWQQYIFTCKQVHAQVCLRMRELFIHSWIPQNTHAFLFWVHGCGWYVYDYFFRLWLVAQLSKDGKKKQPFIYELANWWLNLRLDRAVPALTKHPFWGGKGWRVDKRDCVNASTAAGVKNA